MLRTMLGHRQEIRVKYAEIYGTCAESGETPKPSSMGTKTSRQNDKYMCLVSKYAFLTAMSVLSAYFGKHAKLLLRSIQVSHI